MAITPATAFLDNMALLTGNAGGAVQQLPQVNYVSGKERIFVSTLAINGQLNATIFGVARLPVPAVLTSIAVITDTSLGSATIKFGNAASGNSAIYGAAATVTATDTVQSFAKTATWGQAIVQGYDCQTGLPTTPGNNSGYGGAYEDIILTVGGAALPAAPGAPNGFLRVIVKYAID